MSQLASNKASRSLKKSRGQGMTEYIIIVALIAIAAIGVITLFGDNIRTLFGMSANALAGDTDVPNNTRHSNRAKERKELGNFAKENKAY